MTFFSVKKASEPPDPVHPYGHGKFENVAGTVEMILIFVAGIWIITESVRKLAHPEPIRLPFLGVLVMLAGAGINFAVGTWIKRIGTETKSVAMRSNALHLLTDVFSSLGVGLSLLLVHWTGWKMLDPLIGLSIALYIMKEALVLGRESFLPLVDVSLSEEEKERIRDILNMYQQEYIEYHHLRTRRSGPEEHIDLHLVVPAHMTVEEAHHLCNRIEAEIARSFPQAKVLIHVEPEQERLNEKKTE
jgi:cation diffusion facilitator family transporter